MWGCRKREMCECGGAGEGGGGVCGRAVEAQDSSKKSEYGGVEGGRSVCVWSVWGECMCVNVNVCTV